MSVIGSNIIAGASGQGGGYKLDRSLRFRSSASAYLSRTPASAGNRQIWTYSTWVKRGSLGSQQDVFISGSNVSSNLSFQNSFNSSDNFLIYASLSGVSNDIVLQTTQVFRDPSAWYHIIIAVDTTQATSSNRVKLYINGSQVTSFSTATYPTQNYSTSTNNTVAHTIGRFTNVSANYFDGYMAETHLVDGQALTPSSFGETSTTTGVWQPKRYAGTYGTNGFYLPFTDNSALTSGSNAGLGKDFSGNGNYWNTNNISITAGSTYDSMTDVPTLTSATATNFATFNPLAKRRDVSTNVTFADGNLKATFNDAGGNTTQAWGTIYPTAGKYYWEITVANNASNIAIGIGSQPDQEATANTSVIYVTGGGISKYGTLQTTASSYTTNDVIGIAYDVDSATCAFYKNNTLQYTVTGLTVIPSGSFNRGSTSDSLIANFGQRPFSYTPPTGYVALNTYNLPTPTIGATASTLANKNFDATLYTGTGATKTVTNSGSFQPDLVWVKVRSTSGSHVITDAVRGGNKQLFSNLTNAEATATNKITGFTSSGFTLGADDGSGTGDANFNGSTYVGWQWKASGSTVSNTAGSITSTVSANTSAGFSVVTYTEPASGSYTFGHGLGVSPSMFIVKERNVAGDNWVVWHNYWQSVDPIPTKKGQYLNSTLASFTTGSDWLNSISSTTIGITTGQVTSGGATMVAYCFAEVAGYSKFGSYTGNGSTDGTLIATGFRPAFIMIKRTDTTGNWTMYDATRNTYNAGSYPLYPNLSNAEDASTDHFDWLSNGFKMRSTNQNASGGSYIYMAFAKVPQKFALGV